MNINVPEIIKNKFYLNTQINERSVNYSPDLIKIFQLLVRELPHIDARNTINMILRAYELPSIKSLAQVEKEIQDAENEIELYKKLKIKYKNTEYDL